MDQGDSDKVKQSTQTEASSDAMDEGVKDEEEDVDCQELYGDVNVGERFLQYVQNVKDSKVGIDNRDDHNHDVNAGISQNDDVNEQVTDGGSGGNKIELGQNSSEVKEQVVDRSNVVVAGDSVTGVGETTLFVGNLLWWTTEAQVEMELEKYGRVKDLYFFTYRASGKSNGCCRVEFYDAAAAAACKERMNGHEFNGRPCVVQFKRSSINRMGEPQINANQPLVQAPPVQARDRENDGGGNRNWGRRNKNQPLVQAPPAQARDRENNGWWNSGSPGVGAIPSSGNFQGGDGSLGYGRGNCRGGGEVVCNAQAMGNSGWMDPMGERGAYRYGQGIGFGTPMLHPSAMMAQWIDPHFHGPMGGYGSFHDSPTPPFLKDSYAIQPVGGVGPQGVYPHLNPAFLGQGMPMSTGVGMMPRDGFDGRNMGMWSSDPSMGGWNREEAASDRQLGEGDHDQFSERDWPSSSHRRHHVNVDASREDMSSQDHNRGRSHRRDSRVSRERDRENKRHEEEHFHVREQDRERERDRGRDRETVRRRQKALTNVTGVGHSNLMAAHEKSPEEEHRSRSSSRKSLEEERRSRSSSRKSLEEQRRSRSRDAHHSKRRQRL